MRPRVDAPSTPAPTLTLRDVNVSLWQRSLLSDIGFTLEPGQIMALAGPNGAGKSSLLRLISGELPIAQGAIEFCGEALDTYPPRERARRLALLPQWSTLAFPFSVEEVVLLGRTPHDTGLTRDRAFAVQAMGMTDTLALRDRLYTRLSGGERQRSQLARVFAQLLDDGDLTGRLLLLDEPTAALDLAHQQQVLAGVRALAARGCAAVLVVHDLNLAASVADRLLVLHDGRQIACGPTEQVLTPALFRDVFDVEAEIAHHRVTGLPVITINYRELG